MAFFGNREVNRVNIHYAIQMFAQSSGGAFYFVYLLRAGLPVTSTLLVQAAVLGGRFALRPALLPIAKRLGLKPTLIAGTLILALQYPLISTVHGLGWPLIVLIAVSSTAEVFYWSSYHAYFAVLGDAEHRGHQLGAREALAGLVGIGAPLSAAWALVSVGAGATFIGVGLIQAGAAAPLLGLPNVAVQASCPGGFRAARRGLLLFMADGWFSGCYLYVWQIALFLTLRKSFAAFGGALALASLVGVVGGLMLGRQVDRGRARRAVVLAYGAAVVVIAVRAVSLGRPWLAVLANAPGALLMALLMPVLMTAIYNLAKASPCPLRFHIALEGGWDFGCAGACLTAAAVYGAGASLAWPILLALPGAVAVVVMLTRYYGERRLEAITAAPLATPLAAPLG